MKDLVHSYEKNETNDYMTDIVACRGFHVSVEQL